jgi:hypothetical protein
MNAATPTPTTAFVIPRANSVPSSPLLARLASAMATLEAHAPEFNGFPTNMHYMMENSSEML